MYDKNVHRISLDKHKAINLAPPNNIHPPPSRPNIHDLKTPVSRQTSQIHSINQQNHSTYSTYSPLIGQDDFVSG